MLSGDNGIIKRAGKAKDNSEIAEDKEIIETATIQAMGKNKYGNLEEENLRNELSKYHAEVNPKGSNFNIKMNGRDYIVSKTGDVNYYEYMKSTDIYWRFDSNNGMLYLRSTEKDEKGNIYTKGMSWSEYKANIKEVTIEEPIAPTSTNSMFFECTELTKFNNIHNLHTENVENMMWMFGRCRKIKEIDVTGFDTSKATNMGYMFNGCNALEKLDVSGFDTTKAKSLAAMFTNCYALKQIDVSHFDTSKVTAMENIFSNCEKLETIYVSNSFNIESVTSSKDMFLYSSKLIGGNGTKYSSSFIDKTYARIDNPPDSPGYFTLKE